MKGKGSDRLVLEVLCFIGTSTGLIGMGANAGTGRMFDVFHVVAFGSAIALLCLLNRRD